MWTLESKDIDFEPVDISDPNRRKIRDTMFEKLPDPDKRLRPPQIFNDDNYVGVRNFVSVQSTAFYFC